MTLSHTVIAALIMEKEFSEINSKLEKLEGDVLESIDEITPMELNELTSDVKPVEMHNIEYASCGCYTCCGSEYARNGKCPCYTSCGSNYNKG